MDLIYSNSNKEDVGVMQKFSLDFAYGSSENDFECTVDRINHCCDKGFFLYIENTEYGGIIDAISIDTARDEVVYKGRTWHGILEHVVICPDAGEDYLVVDGDANDVLRALIERMGVSDIFSVETEASGIFIDAYQFERYSKGYAGIRKMLQTFHSKLKIVSVSGGAVISAVPFVDYSEDEEFDSNQVSFNITKAYNSVNHLVCLGSGNLADRAVIHLFADEKGGVQPYLKDENPISDDDYILDESGKLIFGEKEIAEIYDYPSAEITENYVLLAQQPSDWAKQCEKYYQMNDDEVFVNVEKLQKEQYKLLTAQPSDWVNEFESYFYLADGEYAPVTEASEYVYTAQTVKPSDWDENFEAYYCIENDVHKSVEPEEKAEYSLLKFKPQDWSKAYSNYYYYWSDGTKYEYRSVSGITAYRFDIQTMKPSDWDENYKKYYWREPVYVYIYELSYYDTTTGKVTVYREPFSESNPSLPENTHIIRLIEKSQIQSRIVPIEKAMKWEADKFYTKTSYQVAPKWESGQYYFCRRYEATPTWESGKYYTRGINTIPTWESGKYYSQTILTVVPAFMRNTFYEKKIDRYAVLVEGGIKKLKEASNGDKISIDFSTENEFDIGDIVGAKEYETGISVWKPITKKIVKIENDSTTIQYEIGDE